MMEERSTHEQKWQVFPCETRTAEVWGVSTTPAQGLYRQAPSASAGEDLKSKTVSGQIHQRNVFFFFPFGIKKVYPIFQRKFWSSKLNGHSCECFENCNKPALPEWSMLILASLNPLLKSYVQMFWFSPLQPSSKTIILKVWTMNQ